MWHDGERVVEEVDSDDTDTQGVGLSGNKRFVSDPLQFTGMDLGEGTSRRRRSYAPPPSDEGASASESHSDDGEEEGSAPGSEERLVESALLRIRRAQAKGKEEVNLTKEELGALERRREKMRADEERRRRRSSEQRFAVPIAQLEPGARKPNALAQPQRRVRERRSLHEGFDEPLEGQGFPPVGYFPPPEAPRSRPRSGTGTPQRVTGSVPGRDDDSPFRYTKAQQPPIPSYRHVSDTAPRSRGSRGPPSQGDDRLPYPDDDRLPYPNASASAPSLRSSRPVDPFQFQTAGPRAPSHDPGAAAARRHVSGPAGDTRHSRGPVPAAVRGGGGSRRVSSEEHTEETTEEEEEEDDEDESSSDERDRGARVRGGRPRGREPIVVELEHTPEPEPEREREPPRRPKKPSSSSSPAKRKPVGGGGTSSRRRKGR